MKSTLLTENRLVEKLLYLTEIELRQSTEAMFFAYRGFTADPDKILKQFGYGRAHHRAIHFIKVLPGSSVNKLLSILGITKQSLNRVLRTLISDGLVRSYIGQKDRRERHLFLTDKGRSLEKQLSTAQHKRLRYAFEKAGPDAVLGFRRVLESMMDQKMRDIFEELRCGGE